MEHNEEGAMLTPCFSLDGRVEGNLLYLYIGHIVNFHTV
jgi:hypothetical protein